MSRTLNIWWKWTDCLVLKLPCSSLLKSSWRSGGLFLFESSRTCECHKRSRALLGFLFIKFWTVMGKRWFLSGGRSKSPTVQLLFGRLRLNARLSARVLGGERLSHTAEQAEGMPQKDGSSDWDEPSELPSDRESGWRSWTGRDLAAGPAGLPAALLHSSAAAWQEGLRVSTLSTAFILRRLCCAPTWGNKRETGGVCLMSVQRNKTQTLVQFLEQVGPVLTRSIDPQVHKHTQLHHGTEMKTEWETLTPL